MIAIERQSVCDLWMHMGEVKGVVRRLRVKLEPDPAHPQYIITEPHLGYRLNDSL